MNTLVINEPWVEWLNTPLQEEPKVDVTKILNRAELLIQADYLEQAIDELNTVINLEHENTYALFMRYCCKLKLGLFTEADEDLYLVNQLNQPQVEA